jgi:hypothetical protein
MVRASGRPTRRGPFGHLYLSTIMMVLASVTAISFTILLLFSLPSCLRLCHPIIGKERGSRRLLPVSAKSVAIARPRERFTACAHHRFHRHRTSRSSSRSSPCSSSPTCCPRPWSQPRADRRSSTRDGTSRSCYWPFSACATEEDTVAPATLRLSWR